jgi:hypothetical protein
MGDRVGRNTHGKAKNQLKAYFIGAVYNLIRIAKLIEPSVVA